jgi:hypothetical protein
MNRGVWLGLVLSGLLLLGGAGPAAAQAPKNEDLAKAIQKGVAYLKKIQKEDGSFPHEQAAGGTALAGWTLLECGVRPEDPSVQKAAAFFRKQLPTLDHMYSLTLGIFFLDRLGDQADIFLIEVMSARLMATQNAYGGWPYFLVSRPPEDEVKFLTNYVTNAKFGTLNPKAPKDRPARTFKQITPVIQPQAQMYAQAQPRPDGNFGDHSVTQFAMMGLWVARRYGFPVDAQLMRTERRFRAGQEKGGWGYEFKDGRPTLALTCAGLLGIALGNACDPNPNKKDLHTDAQVLEALSVVASTIGNPVGERTRVPSLAGQGKIYYALWSLERMAVVYGLEDKKIGTKDWFGWGAELLLYNQQADGSWTGEFAAGGCDTCFALLFLKRANVATDLTAKAKPDKLPEIKVEPRLQLPDLPNITAKEDPGKGTTVKEKPKDKGNGDAMVLGQQLVDAAPAKRDEVLKKFKAGQGNSYTEVLAATIPKLDLKGRTAARHTLTERLYAGTNFALGKNLNSEDPELRRAAAEVAGQKKSKEHIPELIGLLEDSKAIVARAAKQALFTITNQNFGPDPEADATPADWAAAAKTWRDWYKKQPK